MIPDRNELINKHYGKDQLLPIDRNKLRGLMKEYGELILDEAADIVNLSVIDDVTGGPSKLIFEDIFELTEGRVIPNRNSIRDLKLKL